jgi:hypothetical protein
LDKVLMIVRGFGTAPDHGSAEGAD